MEKNEIIKSISLRTNGEIYLGVVGAVRTGKSTFIKRFIETLVLPNIEDEYDRRTRKLKLCDESASVLVENNDFEALETESIGEMKKALNPEVIEDARRQVGSDWGEIQSFGDFYMSEIRQRGQRYAVVQVAVMYENVEVTYTITFDENMKLAGLYMK